MDIGLKIKELMGQEKIDTPTLARKLGKSKQAVYDMLEKSDLNTSILRDLSTIFNVPVTFFLTDESTDMLVKKIEDEPLPAATKTSSIRKGIPLIPLDAVAGFASIDNDGVRFEDCERYSIPEFEDKGASFLIRVSGDSMMPLYNNGDIIACRKIAEIHFFQWGGVYVLDTSQGVLVKYVEECDQDNDCIVCISENKRYKPFRLPKGDIRSMSTIVGLVRLV